MITKPGLLLAALVSFTIVGSSYADARPASYDKDLPSQEETTGFISGAAIGAAVGGPPGAIVGAALGAFLGDGWVTRKDYDEMQGDWVAMQLEMDRMRKEVSLLEEEKQIALRELDDLRRSPTQVLPAFLDSGQQNPLFDNTAISIHFRSGSSNIEDHYQDQLSALVKLAQQLPNSALEVTGYADRNGEAADNLNLSWQRSNSVKQFISALGVEESEINSVAYGETQPLHSTQSFETDFFDRRVLVRLIDTSKQMLTQGQ